MRSPVQPNVCTLVIDGRATAHAPPLTESEAAVDKNCANPETNLENNIGVCGEGQE